jgi:hypothetical protein
MRWAGRLLQFADHLAGGIHGGEPWQAAAGAPLTLILIWGGRQHL